MQCDEIQCPPRSPSGGVRQVYLIPICVVEGWEEEEKEEEEEEEEEEVDVDAEAEALVEPG